MVVTQLAKIVATLPINNDGKILAQPKNSLEKVNAVVMRGGKSTRDPPNPNNKARKAQGQWEEGPSPSTKHKKIKKKMRKRHKTLLIQVTCRFNKEKKAGHG